METRSPANRKARIKQNQLVLFSRNRKTIFRNLDNLNSVYEIPGGIIKINKIATENNGEEPHPNNSYFNAEQKSPSGFLLGIAHHASRKGSDLQSLRRRNL